MPLTVTLPGVDIDAFVGAHYPTWQRLEHLVHKRRNLSGTEVDELVELYQRVATHLSIVRSSSTDHALIGRLSTLVAKARSAVTGAHAPARRDLVRFWKSSFPAVAYRMRWWWLGCALGSVAVALVVGAWVAGDPQVQRSIAAPDEIRQLCQHDFANYYSEHPALSFALRVWTNNIWVAAQSLAFGMLLGLPVLWVLWQNALNGGVIGGLMFSCGKGDIFFGLITPHGLLELTAVFLATAAGLRLGWAVIDPGPRRRGEALAEEGRAAVSIVPALFVVLLVSGLIEALVTPSPLPTWARIVIGVLAELVFLWYVISYGRRAVRRGETSDIEQRPDTVPVAG